LQPGKCGAILAERWPWAATSNTNPEPLALIARPGSLPARTVPTPNTGAAAGAHPIELALVAGIATAEALLVLIAAAIALVLTLAGWCTAGANAPIRLATVQMHQAPLAHPLHQLLAELPVAKLRELCAAAGRRPGRSRVTALSALLLLRQAVTCQWPGPPIR
jgi:hypothetical protein